MMGIEHVYSSQTTVFKIRQSYYPYTLMKTFFIILFLLLPGLILIRPGYAQDKKTFLREDFNDIKSWRPLHFPKIKEHSTYSIESTEDGNFLKAESNASASAMVYSKTFNVFEYPLIRWRWKISNVYKKGNAREKSGDDYPIRVYIIFKYNPEKTSFGKKIKYGLAKKLYGEYPPDSSLNYIWANRKHTENVITSPYTNEQKMIILQTGAQNINKWQQEEVNVVQHYKDSFGTDPPSEASIAVMNDSDNTKESSVSFIDYMEVYR
jgi:hypothetical protein